MTVGESRVPGRRHPLRTCDIGARDPATPPGPPTLGRVTRVRCGASVGLLVGLGLVVVALVVPWGFGWEVWARSAGGGVPPLHGRWHPTFGPGTLPAVALALLACRYAVDLAERLPWHWLLAVAYVAGFAWLVSLALVDGVSGLTHTVNHRYDYLLTARAMTDVPAALATWVDRIPIDDPDNWTVHVAGHPPLATLIFVALVRVGLGGSLATGLVVTALGATAPPAVLVTLRTLGAEVAARRAAPYLVLSPAALFVAVSADGMFAALGAWGLAALAAAATRDAGLASLGWAVVAGLLLGACVMVSYGLPLLGLLALAVLRLTGSWRPLPAAAVAALAVVLVFVPFGFSWWEAYPVLHDRYWDGLAARRPAAYWMWGNLAALLLCAGPLLGAGLGRLAELRVASDRVVRWMVSSAGVAVLVADLSRMSKSEVERIWLPFVPWLLLSTALLPDRWRRTGLALQVATALVLQHLLFTSW